MSKENSRSSRVLSGVYDKPHEISDLELLELYLRSPQKQRDERFASTARAAEMTGLTQRTIQLWVETGEVRAVHVGRKYVISLDSLTSHLKGRIG